MSNKLNPEKVKKSYDKLFEKDPLLANMFLMLCEQIGERHEDITRRLEAVQKQGSYTQLAALLHPRFKDPVAYHM